MSIDYTTIDGTTSAADNQTIPSGYGIIFNSGGKGSGNTLTGGDVIINAGASVSNTTINSGSMESSGGTIDGLTISGGTATIGAGTTLEGDIEVSGQGVLTIGVNGAVSILSNTSIVASGGYVYIAQTGVPSIRLGGNATLLVSEAALGDLKIGVFSGNYTIEIIDLDASTITSIGYKDNKTIIYTTNGNIIINGILPDIKFASNGNGGTIITECFAEGTLISTPDGARLVETLNVGDLVETHVGPLPIRWIGKRDVDLRGTFNLESCLVRIKANAFEDGIPARDLWITAEHGVMFGDKLIRARMLVNGGSIAYDKLRRQFTYYHFSFDRHAIVYAEGLAAESYQNGSENSPFGFDTISPEALQFNRPLNVTTELDIVKPIWEHLAERSRQMGMTVSHPGRASKRRRVSVTTNSGERAQLRSMDGDDVVYAIPANTKYIVVESDALRPDMEFGPFWDDRRHLGVRVGCVALSSLNTTYNLSHHLHDLYLGGWNNVEDGHSRWTTGKGIIHLRNMSNAQLSGNTELRISFPDAQKLDFM